MRCFALPCGTSPLFPGLCTTLSIIFVFTTFTPMFLISNETQQRSYVTVISQQQWVILLNALKGTDEHLKLGPKEWQYHVRSVELGLLFSRTWYFRNVYLAVLIFSLQNFMNVLLAFVSGVGVWDHSNKGLWLLLYFSILLRSKTWL